VDRIVLNAYFRLGHSPGGFRFWWQRLTGSDETLDNAHLMRMAGRFSRRVRGWAQAHQIPVIDCSVGERKHEIAEQQLEKTKVTRGIFLILVSRAQAPVWEVRPRHHLERKKPMPYVNHYSFHLLDPDWGHVTIKICGHPPFPAQVILNGHEYVACQARKAGLHFVKEGNCFTHVSDSAGLAQLADTLLQPGAIGQLGQVCDHWIYSACLCFALDLDQQKHSGFHYDYSIYQLEYSRNLIFEVGHHMDQVFQALIDRSRAPLDLKTIKTILGTRRRPRYRARKKRSAEWEVAVERPVYDLTIFKLHCGKLTLKCYTKGERVLRIEAMAHNTQELDCGRSLAKFPKIVSKLKAILERFSASPLLHGPVLHCRPDPGTIADTHAGWPKPGWRHRLQQTTHALGRRSRLSLSTESYRLLRHRIGLSGAESRRSSRMQLWATPSVLRPEKVPR
jgi:hypothetical protein